MRVVKVRWMEVVCEREGDERKQRKKRRDREKQKQNSASSTTFFADEKNQDPADCEASSHNVRSPSSPFLLLLFIPFPLHLNSKMMSKTMMTRMPCAVVAPRVSSVRSCDEKATGGGDSVEECLLFAFASFCRRRFFFFSLSLLLFRGMLSFVGGSFHVHSHSKDTLSIIFKSSCGRKSTKTRGFVRATSSSFFVSIFISFCFRLTLAHVEKN